MKLTKCSEVLEALDAGACIIAWADGRGLSRLINAQGEEVDAWQNAIRAAVRHDEVTETDRGATDGREWIELRKRVRP